MQQVITVAVRDQSVPIAKVPQFRGGNQSPERIVFAVGVCPLLSPRQCVIL